MINKRLEILQLIWDLKDNIQNCGKRYKEEREAKIRMTMGDSTEYDEFDEEKFRKVLSPYSFKIPDDQINILKLYIYQNNYELDPHFVDFFIDGAAE